MNLGVSSCHGVIQFMAMHQRYWRRLWHSGENSRVPAASTSIPLIKATHRQTQHQHNPSWKKKHISNTNQREVSHLSTSIKSSSSYMLMFFNTVDQSNAIHEVN